MSPTPKKPAGTRTARPRKAEAVTMADLVEMLGLVQRELHLIASGMSQLIREGKGGEAALVPKIPTLLVGPYCQITLPDLLQVEEPIEAVDANPNVAEPWQGTKRPG